MSAADPVVRLSGTNKSHGGARAVTVVLPLPPKELSPNSRTYYMVKARVASDYRMVAYLAAQGCQRPCFGACRARVQVTWPDKRRRDLDNLLASCKSAFDGFTDAGIWIDDSRVTWEIPPACVDKATAGIVVTVTEAT